jgi:tRNA pseudouridine32 synthase / 23S rRNA pseudouridine746 synthase
MPKGDWPTVFAFLCERFPSISAAQWQIRLARGDVFDDAGQVVDNESPYPGIGKLHYFRDPPGEREIPFTAQILYQDERILIADKPHFLPVVPAGNWLQQTLLVRLKNQTGCMDLVPAHRIDQDTAGLVLFTKQARFRNAYHALFRDQQIRKRYRAIVHTPSDALLLNALPMHYQSRLVSSDQFLQMQTVDGPANAYTHITLHRQINAQYLEVDLSPRSGLRHQLRAQLAALGMPILGDRIYPELQAALNLQDDAAWVARFQQPLRLLAAELAFVDPIDALPRNFHTQLQLAPPP